MSLRLAALATVAATAIGLATPSAPARAQTTVPPTTVLPTTTAAPPPTTLAPATAPPATPAPPTTARRPATTRPPTTPPPPPTTTVVPTLPPVSTTIAAALDLEDPSRPGEGKMPAWPKVLSLVGLALALSMLVARWLATRPGPDS